MAVTRARGRLVCNHVVQSRTAPTVHLNQSEMLLQERGRFVGDARDFVRCLPIEFSRDLGLKTAVVQIAKRLEFLPSEVSLRPGDRLDLDAHTDARAAGDGGHDAPCAKSLAAVVVGVEHEDLVIDADLLAAVHRLLGERE
jgi:hypothetical protein